MIQIGEVFEEFGCWDKWSLWVEDFKAKGMGVKTYVVVDGTFGHVNKFI
jgi:hypothetical protein